jgi:hypothetical protein
MEVSCVPSAINPLNAELNPIRHLLALLAHPILHISRVRVNVPCEYRVTLTFTVSERLLP